MPISRKSALLYDMKQSMYSDFKEYIFEICKNTLKRMRPNKKKEKCLVYLQNGFQEKSQSSRSHFQRFKAYLYNDYFYKDNGDVLTNTATHSRAVRLAKMKLRNVCEIE